MASKKKLAEGEWAPQFSFDLLNGTPKRFQEVVDDFGEWAANNPSHAAIALANDWHDITPQVAEELLKRNTKNRRPGLSDVYRYHVEMKAGEWKKTGQPIIITIDGDILDGGHRLWACYFGGVPFRTFVVADVPSFTEEPELFAYVDDGRPRSLKAAFETANIGNGLSGLCSQMATFGYRYDNGLIRTDGKGRRSPMTKRDGLHYAVDHPDMVEASKVYNSNYRKVGERLGSPGIAAFMTWRIIEGFDEDVCHEFMTLLMADETKAGVYALPADSPANALLKTLARGTIRGNAIGTDVRLAYTISAFNAWRAGHTTKSAKVWITDTFPTIGEADEAFNEAA